MTTPPTRYIHVRNWDRYQHPDVTRANRPAPWIKEYVQQIGEYEYVALTFRQRGILHGFRLLYAANRGSGLGCNVAQLGRMMGAEKVRLRDIEALNDAGFIEFSASRKLAPRLHDAEQDVDVDVETPLHARESETARTGPVWDELARMFGPVAVGTKAAEKRAGAVSDLEAMGATVDELKAARAKWPSRFSVGCTDVALARHFPLLRPPAKDEQSARSTPCPECQTGGGLHLESCSVGAALASNSSPAASSQDSGGFGAFVEDSA